MKKALLITLIILVVVLLGLQFVPVDRDNPAVVKNIDAPPEVAAILKRSCYDCHSNETVWPWYSKVAPMSFLVADHVEEGREHLNFSEWPDDPEKQAHLLEESLEEIEEGEMPLDQYLWLHAEAVMSEADRSLLENWAKERMAALSKGGLTFDDFAEGTVHK